MQEQLRDWWEQGQKGIEEFQSTAKQWWEGIEKQGRTWVDQFEEIARQNFDLATETVKQASGKYLEDAYSILEKEAKRRLSVEYSSAEKVGELEKKRGLLTEAFIFATKLVPVYDEKQ